MVYIVFIKLFYLLSLSQQLILKVITRSILSYTTNNVDIFLNEIFQKKITNINNQEVFKIKIINDNNYSLEFFNFGGYIHSINIPYVNDNSKTEDVLLGYNNFQEYKNDEYYINALVGRVCGRITKSKFKLNGKTYNLFPNDFPNSSYVMNPR